MGHAAQCLQAPDDFLHRRGSQLHHFHNRLFQALNPFSHMLNFVQTIQQRRFLRWLRVVDLMEPGQVTLRPSLQSQRRTLARAEQKLG
jgi:hypothetical protein